MITNRRIYKLPNIAKIMAKPDYKITRERTEMQIFHEDRNLTFIFPAKGPGSYAGVQEQITKDRLKAPNFAETASLVYTAYKNSNEPEFKNVLDILNKEGLWAFTGNLYIPKGKGDYQNGVIIQDNPQIKNGRIFMDESELVKKLEANDKSVRFVPFGFKIGEHSVDELEKNAYVIGLAGEEGAEKLAEIAGKYKARPVVYSFGEVNEKITRASVLGGNYWDGGRLVVDGGYVATTVMTTGMAMFGVSLSADEGSASAPKNKQREVS